ncbi:MAG: hypothetical protein ACRDTP_06905 [Mycobacteriales bacterium]
MGILLIVLLCWLLASVVVGLLVGAAFRRRDRQVSVVVVADRRPTPEPAGITIPAPRSASRAETEVRTPSRR